MATAIYPRTGPAESNYIGIGSSLGGSTDVRSKSVASFPASFTVDFIDLRTGKSILSQGAVHTRSEFKESYDNGPVTATHLITVSSNTFLEQVFTPLSLAKDSVLGVRIGVQVEKGTLWLPIETHWITYYDSEPSERAGTFQLCFHTADGLWAIDSPQKTLARTGRISEIVQAIATSWGMQAIICKTNASVHMIQSFQSDLDFIVQRLIPRAVAEGGRVDFRLRMRANTLIFGPIDFKDAQMAIWDVNTLSPAGAITDIVEEDRSNTLLPMGGSGVRAVQASPYGTPSESLSDINSILRLGAFAPDSEDQSQFVSVPVTESEDMTEANAKAQNVFAKQRAEMYQARFTLTNVFGMRVGDFVRFFTPDRSYDSETSDPTSQAGSMTGYYLRSIETEIEGGNCIQKCVCARGQLSYVPKQVAFPDRVANFATGISQGVTQNAAGGIDPQMPVQGSQVLDPSGKPTDAPLPELPPELGGGAPELGGGGGRSDDLGLPPLPEPVPLG